MKKIIGIIIVIIVLGGGGMFWWAKTHKGVVVQKAINVADDVLKLDQLDDSTRAEFGVIQDIANALLVQDDVTRRYLILLQNNLELRPGGGFLGQFAVIEVKNGEVLSFVVEDTNNLDSTYKSDRVLPEKLQQYLNDTKKIKMRDSNYAPDFPENVQDALHFYALAGRDANFDGVIAVNASILEDLLAITGPVTITRKDWEKFGAFESDGGLMKLQKAVEEPVFRADERKKCEKALKKAQVPKEDERWRACQYDKNGKKLKKMTHGQRAARKEIVNELAQVLLHKLFAVEYIEPLIKMATKNLDNKTIQLWFKDPALQEMVTAQNWGGVMDQQWQGDYVMVVDANVGALKSDFYITRALEYTVDFTGKSAEANDPSAGRMVRYVTEDVKNQVLGGTFRTQKPLATMRMTYTNTATEASYFNSDYHCFTRLFVPTGTKWYVREWFEAPGSETDVYGGKNMYGYKFDVLLGDTIPTMLQYTLPDTITEDNYTLKIQKQSGIGDIPLTVTVITSDGVKHTQEVTFTHDMIFALKEVDGKTMLVDISEEK